MRWYKYREGNDWIIRLMSRRHAEEKGATLVPNFNPARKTLAAVVTAITLDGDLERLEPLTAEIPRGRA